MSKTPNYDAAVKKILDTTEPGDRICELTGEKWLMDEEEISWFKRFNVPPSPYSRKIRLWHLASYFTVYQWWWNKHFETGEPVLTYAHPASGIRVLPDKEWFAKDFSEVTVEFSVQRPFFESFRELQLKVPLNATRNFVEPENSITVVSRGDKDSFFVSACISKDSAYVLDTDNADRCFDCKGVENLTDCYRVANCVRLFSCKFAFESVDCSNCSFVFDCRNCEFCFGATNQRNKKFVFFNQQLTEEEWQKKVAEINLGNFSNLQTIYKKFVDLINEQGIWPENFSVQTENSTGDYLIKCNDCVQSTYGLKSFNNYYCYGIFNGAQNNAFSCAVPAENCYQTGPASQSANSKFSITLVRCDDCEYCFNCFDCEHCFGCVGLQKKKFAIFNQEYSESEYWQKVDELKCAMLERGEYGRPIPMAFSFAYYPESGPVMYLGAEISDWDKLGIPKFAAGADDAFGESRLTGKVIRNAADIPENISDLGDDWIGVPIADIENNRPFAFLKNEVEFYRRQNIAPPHQHFTARIRDLLYASNSGVFEEKKCESCDKKVIVGINRIFRNKHVFCHDCYLKYLEKNN